MFARVCIGTRGLQTEVLQVACHELCAFSGNGAVEKEFDGGQLGIWGADFAFVVDSISARGESHSFFPCFLGAVAGHDV